MCRVAGKPREEGKRGAGGGCREGGAASQTAEPSQASVRPPAWPPPAMSRASGVHLTGTGLPGRSAAPVIYLRAAWKAWRGRRRGSGAQHLRPLFHVLAAARHLTGAVPATPATQSGSALEQSCACVPIKLREALF